jgi:transketolase
VAVDAEVGNSTHSEEFKDAYPDRFFEMYIAEQQMVSASVGLQVRKYVPFSSTFAAFYTRAYDFIRMAAISRANIKLCGSHAGVSIGEDGPSQMGLEDIAMMRAVFGSTVLYPCDANQTAKLLDDMADHEGIDYMRTTRGKTPVIYSSDEEFEIGGSKVLRESDGDQVAVVAAGITVPEALKAYDTLKGDGITIRVIDAYSVKPIDADTLRQAAGDCGNRIVTVEDHWCEGGLGDAVLDAFAGTQETLPTVVKLAVHEMPCSGTPEELLHWAGIDAESIAEAVRGFVGGKGSSA